MTPSPSPDGKCIQRIFEARAAATPHSIALRCGSARLTYRELNERSNQLAHHLRRSGAAPEVIVGLCLERGIELIVGLLGILKSGAAYVPIDPQYPPDRRSFMLADSQAPLIVTQASLAADLNVAGVQLVVVERDSALIALEPTENLPACEPHHLAYVIYTSGSTGTPKGAMISHHNVARLFSATQPWFNFGADDVWTLFHSCAFDFSVWEIWGALFHGGVLVIVPFDVSRTPDAFLRLLSDEKVTVLNQTPSAFRQLIRAEEHADGRELSLRFVIFGGEALDFASLKPWFDRHGDTQPCLVNMYGITETTVHVTYRPITAADVDGVSVLGLPIPDLEIELRNDAGNVVPAGEPGEIYIGGAGVCRGYLNRPALTAQRFIDTSDASHRQRRYYRSGDLGRYLPNGDLAYLGRIDSQVKIRGFRIELGEITAALGAHPAVRDSVVLVRESATGEKTLAAYILKRAEQDVGPAALRRQLRGQLPEYMVPANFYFIDALPLTVNGKLDVAALTALQVTEPASVATSSGSELEQRIAAVWREVLKVPTVDNGENFFDVGGNSSNLADVHQRLQSVLGRQFSITDLYAHSTVSALAEHFSKPAAGAAPAIRSSAAQARAELQRGALAAQRHVRRGRP